jgi:hypothetical protein
VTALSAHPETIAIYSQILVRQFEGRSPWKVNFFDQPSYFEFVWQQPIMANEPLFLLQLISKTQNLHGGPLKLCAKPDLPTIYKT